MRNRKTYRTIGGFHAFAVVTTPSAACCGARETISDLVTATRRTLTRFALKKKKSIKIMKEKKKKLKSLTFQH